MAIVRNTVDRLDKPSAYFNSRSKRRRTDRDARDEEEPEQPVDDPLKDATTLYVGNL
jgi:nuclear cap-binding protein subunit 2